MDAAIVVVGVFLALLVAYSAAMKLTGRPDVVESYARVGVDRWHLPILAAVLFAGAGV